MMTLVEEWSGNALALGSLQVLQGNLVSDDIALWGLVKTKEVELSCYHKTKHVKREVGIILT